jgi:Fur family transcriptional regulator, ferric uptake regulator
MARPSHVRDAVSLLLSERHAWTVDEAHSALERRSVPADRASVHRALVRLCEEGRAKRFDVGDGRARFEVAGHHHEHIVCDDCGVVAAVPGCLVDEDVVARRTGFAVSGHSLTLHGRCEECG